MKRLTLTFDNGPTPGITDIVLDVLETQSIRATFFVLGKQLEDANIRAIAERAFRDGHRLGNHSYSHGPPLGLQTEPGIGSHEILATYRLLGVLAGSPPLYRPNGRGSAGSHLLNQEAAELLSSLGATIALWTDIPRDRKVVVDRPDQWVEDAKQAVMSQDWTVLVLHDRPSGFDPPGPMAYLADFLEWAAARVEFRQDFPVACTPMIAGVPSETLKQFVTTS
jgi:peptidoglycan/xylan/chitin deacetylase (PgdA/CDA1 family)